MNFANSSIAC